MFSKYEGIADITLLFRNMLGKSMNSIPFNKPAQEKVWLSKLTALDMTRMG